MKKTGTIIIVNGVSCAGKSSIQRAFQQGMLPELWVAVGIDNLFDAALPDVTKETKAIWQAPNPIRWVETAHDSEDNPLVTLHVGPEGDAVARAMNSAIAAYAQSGCNVIADYIAYKQEWLDDLAQKCADIQTYVVAVRPPLAVVEQREKERNTSPVGHARSHYQQVYGTRAYDCVLDSSHYCIQEAVAILRDMIGQ